ncbi:unnamed protein product [Adineta ricciae]|uniref:Uncharacterized protein n=1 Tax=Adineta ricciae TaxID=249248 RepID=A0A816CDH9_ADIRI|nr:unnamed protein product [Adineta ricciae]
MSQGQNPYGNPYPQEGGFPGYPPQQFGGYAGQPGGYPVPPPNVYGQNTTAYPPPPPVLPRPDIPKDDEHGTGEWGNFNGLESKEIRRVFIRKVYSILSIQLLITFGIIALFHFTPSIRGYVRSSEGQWLYWTSYVVFLVTYIALACCRSAGRRFPTNMILLGILTLSMSYMMGMISAFYTIDSVLIAVGITVFVCLGVTLFSFQTKFDFTSCMGVIFVISLALMGFGIVCIFVHSEIMFKIYAGLGAVAFSIFLAVDTQLIMGGKRHEISAEDHIFAALMLYIDVVYIFLYILSLLDDRITSKTPLLPNTEIEKVTLTNSTIVITACCRNVRRNLPGFQRNIQSIAKLFGNYRIYLGESDSDDETLTYLNQWKNNDSDHVRVYTYGQQRWKLMSRTNRIAFCRNTLLSEARQEIPSFDYYFVVDVDVGSSSSFEIKDFLSNFIYPSSSWLAMTATQRAEYYDIWALRIPLILPFDCWKKIKELTSYFIDQSYLIDRLVKIHQKSIPRHVPLIEVESAFGGAALYNGKYLNKHCSYNGNDQERQLTFYSQCEHVPFHSCIQKYAKQQKIYINPVFQIC